MFHILASLFFAGACAAALMAITLTMAAYKEKMMAALRMQPLNRQPAPWRVPPRRPARSMPSPVIRQIRINRAAA